MTKLMFSNPGNYICAYIIHYLDGEFNEIFIDLMCNFFKSNTIFINQTPATVLLCYNFTAADKQANTNFNIHKYDSDIIYQLYSIKTVYQQIGTTGQGGDYELLKLM